MRIGSWPLAAAVLVILSNGASAATRPVVVELFTSEGCSSCPPADAVLTRLAGRVDVLPLAFHVTYWNALGWRDPFSIQAATDRQATYAATLGGGSYTPEAVVDGRRGMVGSEGDAIASAIAVARAEADRAIPLHVKHTPDGIEVAIDAGAGHGQVLLIGFDPHHQTQVGRGENSGRTLTESNVVRSMRVIGRYDGAPLRLSTARGLGQRDAVIVQASDGRIVAATMPDL